MAKRIILLDGTGNAPNDHTNVSRLQDLLLASDPHLADNIYYERGVGTEIGTLVTGLAVGNGLSHNIKRAYDWLCTHYQPGDEIYAFGFSRGAFTARSLCGLIHKCGILVDRHSFIPRLGQFFADNGVFKLYQDQSKPADGPDAAAFRAQHSHPMATTRIKFLGVWDTVGALGFPWGNDADKIMPWGREDYAWHNVELTPIIESAFHALAIDEQRDDFTPTLFLKEPEAGQTVAQRWFPGAHANVGGGYSDVGCTRLPRRPLAWIVENAIVAGLPLDAETLRTHLVPQSNDHLAPIDDSYMQFLGGEYAKIKRRRMRRRQPGVNQTIDTTAWDRWHKGGEDRTGKPQALPGAPYRPAFLDDFPQDAVDGSPVVPQT